MIVCAKDGQSLVDLALMTTGATEGVWALALRNGMSVTGEVDLGAEMSYESEDVEDPRIAKRYEAEGICPATEVCRRTLAALLNEAESEIPPAYDMIVGDEPSPHPTKSAVFGIEFEASFA